MRYKYSKFAFVCSYIILGVVVLSAVLLYGVLIGAEKSQHIKAFSMSSVAFVAFTSMYAHEYWNRYVEMSDEHIRFNSFRVRKIKNVVSLNIKYEDIFSIKSRKIPLIGLWAIKINARTLPHEITLSFCFCEHKKMFKAICDEAKQHKPDIYIDSYLQNYLEKKYEE